MPIKPFEILFRKQHWFDAIRSVGKVAKIPTQFTFSLRGRLMPFHWMGFHSVCKVIISPVHSHARNPVKITLYLAQITSLSIPEKGKSSQFPDRVLENLIRCYVGGGTFFSLPDHYRRPNWINSSNEKWFSLEKKNDNHLFFTGLRKPLGVEIMVSIFLNQFSLEQIICMGGIINLAKTALSYLRSLKNRADVIIF